MVLRYTISLDQSYCRLINPSREGCIEKRLLGRQVLGKVIFSTSPSAVSVLVTLRSRRNRLTVLNIVTTSLGCPERIGSRFLSETESPVGHKEIR